MSDSARAKVEIVNRALVKLGQPPSYIDGEESSLAGVVDMIWPGLEARVTAIYDWTHFRQTMKPDRHATTPSNGWAHGFPLPGTRIGDPLAILSSINPETYLRHFMLEAGNVYANIPKLWVRVRVASDPSQWDAGFAEAFTVALSGEFAIPLLQDEELAAMKTADAFGPPRDNGSGGMFGRLIALNRAAQPQGRGFMANDPLTQARHG